MNFIGVSTTFVLVPLRTTVCLISVRCSLGVPSVTFPVVSSTLYGVVVTTLPSVPSSVTSSPTSLVGSDSYRVVTGIVCVTTLSCAPTLTTLVTGCSVSVVGVFAVTSPVVGFIV